MHTGQDGARAPQWMGRRARAVRRPRRAPGLAVTAAAIAVLAVGCGRASVPAAHAPGPGTPGTAAPGPAAAASPAQGVAAGDGSAAFCTLARARGAASLLSLRDSSAQGGGLRKVLARLDALTVAAPVAIKADFTRLDRLEHALLGGPPDPQQLAKLDSPDTLASLQRIQGYLTVHCGIGA